MRATSCDPQLPKAEGSEMDEADKSIAELRRTHFPKGSKFPEEGMEFLRAEHTGSRLGLKKQGTRSVETSRRSAYGTIRYKYLLTYLFTRPTRHPSDLKDRFGLSRRVIDLDMWVGSCIPYVQTGGVGGGLG